MPDINILLNLLTQFAWLGNWLFFTLAFIESAPFVGVFIPGATLISVGGILASQGYLNAWDIIFFATLGAIFGDFFSYSLGRWGGSWIKDKKIININILNHGEKFFEKYGNKSIFWGRFFGPIRAIIPFIAGLSKMKKGPFVFWNILSSICWAMLNVFVGYFSGTLIVAIFKKWSGRLSLILILILITTTLYWIVKKKGQSIQNSFRISSIKFVKFLNNQKWFNKLATKYPFISYFINESNRAEEKIFGGTLIFVFLTIIYFLIIILDIF
ncbi:MAG: DedA family protein [Candidatus Nomurabacteria bacterium]|nr:DedA family protein [Candidatus Nomurabacteria bacterium]